MLKYTVEETASYLIYRVGRLLRHKAAQYLTEHGQGISPEQWVLLLKIADQGPVPLSDLVDKTLADHPNVTRLTGQLEAKGLISREPNPDDRRSSLLQATPEARQFIQKVLPDLYEEKARFYEPLTEPEVAMLIRILGVVEANLTA